MHIRVPGILIPLAFCSCNTRPYPEVAVDFKLPAHTSPADTNPTIPTLHFSVGAMQSATNTFEQYSPLVERLGELLGTKTEMVQRRTYGEINDLLATGRIEIGFICTGAYLNLLRHAPHTIELLAVPIVRGQNTYRSLIIASSQSGVTRWQDLEQKRFAFTDELSLTGRAYPVSLLRAAGRDPEHFFSSTLFTHSHDRSIQAVAKQLVDGAAVDELVFEDLAEHNPELKTAVRVVKRSQPLGMPPLVISTRVPEDVRARVRRALLDMTADPKAAAAMKVLHIDRFAPPPANLYDDASRLLVDFQ